MSYYQQRVGPRFEYRDEMSRQVNSAPCLAEKYPHLKGLTVDLGHYSSEGTNRNSQIKFMPNLDTARTVFRIECPNQGCIAGDFDLTTVLARAVADQKLTVAGEVRCEGWMSKTAINVTHCHNILKYTLNLQY